MNKTIIALLALIILLISGLSSAQNEQLPLNPPPGYYGTITVNGQPAAAGTIITAKIGGEERGYITTTTQGFYGDDPGPAKLWIKGYQNEIGSTLTFYVSGVAAQQTAKLSEAGITSRVDLTFEGVPVPTVPTGASGGGGGGSGGSGGGGGTGTEEPFDNILKYLVVYGDLISNTPVTYDFNVMSGSGIYEIDVTGKENESDIPVRLELLKGTSKLVKAPPDGSVYANENIWAGTKKITEGLIRFRVENSWIELEGLADSSDVKMYRWDGSKWEQLGTTEISKDANYTYYEAKTYAFSPFAISGTGGIKGEATPAAIQPEVTPETTGALKTNKEAFAAVPVTNMIVIIGAVILLISIVAVVLYFKKK